MKSVINAPICEKKERPFPKLMKSRCSGAIILATGRDRDRDYTGIIVSGKSSCGETIGWGNNKAFDKNYFEDFEGTVTLSND